jgi:glycosyltransferase involved in cell wall biosynthesis
VRVLRHKRNLGPGAARNTGVGATDQPWVAVLDSDDEWLPHHLATLWPLCAVNDLLIRPSSPSARAVWSRDHQPLVACDAIFRVLDSLLFDP